MEHITRDDLLKIDVQSVVGRIEAMWGDKGLSQLSKQANDKVSREYSREQWETSMKRAKEIEKRNFPRGRT